MSVRPTTVTLKVQVLPAHRTPRQVLGSEAKQLLDAAKGIEGLRVKSVSVADG